MRSTTSTTAFTTSNTSPSLSIPASPLPPPRARSRTGSSYCSATTADASTSALFSSSSSIWNRIRKQSYWWHAAFLLVLTGWVLILFVNTSCRFVEILPNSSSNVTATDDFAPPIPRGIHRGQLLPSTSCQAWGLYSSQDQDELIHMDTSMVITRVVAALSVATGIAVLSGLAYSGMVRPLSFVARWVLVFGSLVTAALQARSRLYVLDGLCENVDIVVGSDVDEEQAAVVYDTCSSDTIAFHLTSATMIIFILAAMLIACDSPYRRVRHADDTIMMTTTMPGLSPPLELAVTSSGQASHQQQQQPRQRSGTTESLTSRRSCPGTPSFTARFPDKDPV